MTSPSNSVKYYKTFVIFYCTLALGCSFMFLSPAIIDFSDQFETTVDQVSRVFTIIIVSYIGGALICGVLYKYLNRQFIITLLFSLMSLSLILTPFCPTITYFYCVNALLGFSLGGCDPALMTWILDVWRHKCPPYVLAKSCCFGIGTFLPPLILQPFLATEEPSVKFSNSSNDTGVTLGGREEGHLIPPFIIGGAIVGLSVLLLLILVCVQKNEIESLTPQESAPLLEKSGEKKSREPEPAPPSDKRGKEYNSKLRTICLVILCCLVIGFFQALEMTMVQFLPTFSVYSKGLSLSEADSAQILSAMTITFAVVQGLAAPVTLRVSPGLIIFGNFGCMLIANVILLVLAPTSRFWLWTASILMGMGISTVFPCFYGFIEKYLQVSDLVSSIIMVFGGTVSCLFPLVVGSWIQENPSILCYATFFSMTISGLAFLLTFYVTVIR